MVTAALYVRPSSVYAQLGADCWDAQRDARRYAGPGPVVAHPPCERWGRFAAGGPSHHGRFVPGADQGCFAAALDAVRRFGGVLEHPAGSRAFAAHGLARPPARGGWVSAGDLRGWVCAVSQGHYGHEAPKPTWLYVAGARSLPDLVWGASEVEGRIEFLCHAKRERTPAPFAALLASIASTCRGAR